MFLAAPPPARGLEPGFPRSRNSGRGVHSRQRRTRGGRGDPTPPVAAPPRGRRRESGARLCQGIHSARGRFSRGLLITRGLLRGPLAPVVDLDLGWASALAWLPGIDRAWRSGRRQEVGLLRTRWGFSFCETLGPVHADRTPVSSGPAGRCRHGSER